MCWFGKEMMIFDELEGRGRERREVRGWRREKSEV
jgi:hypothetical protein